MTCITHKIPSKLLLGKDEYIDIRWPLKWNKYFYLGIWEDERSKIIFLPSFQLATWLIQRTEMKQVY